MQADEWGALLVTKGYNSEDVIQIDLSPSDIKYLYDRMGEALENWDQSEL